MKPFSFLLAFGLIASPGRIFNFDTEPLGKVPPGWTVPTATGGSASQWEILRDRTAPTQPYVLAQLSADPRGNRFPLAILNSVNLRDGQDRAQGQRQGTRKQLVPCDRRNGVLRSSGPRDGRAHAQHRLRRSLPRPVSAGSRRTKRGVSP